jgi:hypothetical protein
MIRESVPERRRRPCPLPGVLLFALASLWGALANAQAPQACQVKSAADYVPADVSGAIVIRDGAAHLEALSAFLEQSALAEEGPLGELLAKPELMQARVMMLGLAAAAGADAWTLAGDLLGTETVLAFQAREGNCCANRRGWRSC